MRLLLPPSEAKTPGGRGASLSRSGFGADVLGDRRGDLCALVERTAAGPRADAVAAFHLPAGAAADAIAVNRSVSTSGTRPALDRYAGVVYAGLAAPSMTPAERRVANRTVLVFSGLFGVVGGGERVPDYRVPAAAQLAGVGTLGGFWRPVLTECMPARLGRTGIVVDLRSSDYAAMWRPGPSLLRRVVVIRMLSVKPDGTLGVISYNSKLAKGKLARALIARVAGGGTVGTVDDVAAVWIELGGTAHRVEAGGQVRLDLVA